MGAVPARLRGDVWDLLSSPHRGGRGLRSWLALMELGGPPLPGELPQELVQVYLRDQEAEPLHDYEACGLPVPVRCGRRIGREPVAEREYFPACPCCGGRTGRHAYWSREKRATS
ncbi:MAG: hypothetical protein U0800_08015 [Isosphaeraceae bacterium]